MRWGLRAGAGVLGAAWLLGLPASAEPLCEPFADEAPLSPRGPAMLASESGTEPARAGGAAGVRIQEGAGGIRSLPGPGSGGGGPGPSSDAPVEVLLVLPKGESGGSADDFELGDEARVVSSFFSPVLCATVVRVQAPPGAKPERLVARAPEGALVSANDVYVTAAEPEVPEATGEDPYRTLQHGLVSSGALEARPVTDGRGAVVAILDSAPVREHRDLPPIEVLGWKAEAPTPGIHGTLMAGIVGAVPENGFGIAGIAPGARLLAVPVCTPQDGGLRDRCLLFDLLRGLDVAHERGAQILNLSLVGPPNPLLERAVDRLDRLGRVVVAAAGNQGTREPRYPAAYPSVVGVAARDAAGRLGARSNRGLSAEMAAPGVEVLSTVPGDAFAFGNGTSLAAAHVSGALALLTAVGGDPVAARRALFRAGSEPGTALAPDLAGLPPVCTALARLGHPCEGPLAGEPGGG